MIFLLFNEMSSDFDFVCGFLHMNTDIIIINIVNDKKASRRGFLYTLQKEGNDGADFAQMHMS